MDGDNIFYNVVDSHHRKDGDSIVYNIVDSPPPPSGWW